MENLPIEQMEKDLIVQREPSVVLEEARKAAKALGDVISAKKKKVIINGEQYLEYEDWMTVARFYGITAKIISSNPISFGEVQGFEAKAVAILVKTGEEISAAEAMCLNDETNWKSRPLFMLRSMAQTRAAAKALRNVLAWVVVLAGYKPTPAEEMEGVNGENKQNVQMPKEKQQSPSQNALVAFGAIESVTQKSGTGKDGKPWVLYTVQTAEAKYTTFSKTLAETAKKLLDEKATAQIGYVENEKGKNLVTIAEYFEKESAQNA